MQVSGTQFYFTEGPVWDPSLNVLYFTDINGDPGATPGGVVYKLTPPATVEVLFQPGGNTDGLGLDPQGNLIGAGFVVARRLACSQGGTMTRSRVRAGRRHLLREQRDQHAGRHRRPLGRRHLLHRSHVRERQPGLPDASTSRSRCAGRVPRDDRRRAAPRGLDDQRPERGEPLARREDALRLVHAGPARSRSSTSPPTARSRTRRPSPRAPRSPTACASTPAGTCTWARYRPRRLRSHGQAPRDHLGRRPDVVTNCAFGGADQKTLYITARTCATLSGAPPLGGGLLYAISDMPVPGMPGRN